MTLPQMQTHAHFSPCQKREREKNEKTDGIAGMYADYEDEDHVRHV